MIGYLLRRVAGLAATLLLAAFLAFLMLDAGEPGFWARFLGFVGSAFTGDFGGTGPLLAGRLAVTVPLAVLALLLAATAGIPLGMLAGMRPGAMANAAVSGAALLAGAVPAVWLGMLLALLLAALLRWLPAAGFIPWERDPAAALGSLLLPALALAAAPAARFAVSARDAAAAMHASGYIRTARLKGMPLAQAVRRHGLRNAALPLVAMLGPQFALLLAGAIVVENVFYLPGLGRLLFAALADGDAALLRGSLLALMAAAAAALLLTDLLQLLADPRLRRGGPP